MWLNSLVRCRGKYLDVVLIHSIYVLQDIKNLFNKPPLGYEIYWIFLKHYENLQLSLHSNWLENIYDWVYLNYTYINDITTSGSMSPLRESKYFLRSWSQCSKTSVSFRSEWRTSCRRTIFLCLSSFKRHISLKADDGTP